MKVDKLLGFYMIHHGEKICSVLRTRSSVKNLTAYFTCDHSRITPAMLRGYRAGEDLAPATINRDFAVLRSALIYARNEGKVRAIPEIPERDGAVKRVNWLSEEQIQSLIAEAARHPGLLAFILLALGTAQRLQAVLGLRWSQVDRTRNTIWFNEHDLSLEKRRKGRGNVTIGPGLAALLDKLKEGNDTPWVLINKHRDRYRDIERDQWARVTAAAGLKGLRPHDLRHTTATQMYKNGIPLLDISKMLGHANTDITAEYYVNHEPSFLAPAAALMDRLTGLAS